MSVLDLPPPFRAKPLPTLPRARPLPALPRVRPLPTLPRGWSREKSRYQQQFQNILCADLILVPNILDFLQFLFFYKQKLDFVWYIFIWILTLKMFFIKTIYTKKLDFKNWKKKENIFAKWLYIVSFIIVFFIIIK